MQIKKFEAQDMTHALRLIKREFGPQAVILSARTLKKEKGGFGFLTRPRVEVTAATDSYQIKSRRAITSKETPELPRHHLKQSDHTYSVKDKVIRHSPGFEIDSASKSGNHASTKSQIRRIHPDSVSLLHRQMVTQGVQENLAYELMSELNAFLSSESAPTSVDLKRMLTHVLVNRGITTRRVKIESDTQKIVAFIGPTGVGKTSTITKLAAAAKIRNKNGSIALITLDNNRIAAVEQLRIYAKIIGIPIQSVSSEMELRKAIDQFRNKSLILVDTAGLSKNNKSQINDLQKILQKFRSLEIHLLVSAATKEADLMETIQRFKPFSFTRLIFTKVDESTTYGNLLNILIRTKVPISYFTNGQEIPGGIEVATPGKLVDLMLSSEKEKKTWPLSTAILKRNISKQDPASSQATGYYQVENNGMLNRRPREYYSVPSRVESFIRKALTMRS